MSEINRMKKAEVVIYAHELERKLKKAEDDLMTANDRLVDVVRAEIREEERKEWVETGLQMAYEELDSEIFEMETRGEITDDLAFRLKTKIRQCLDALDVASIVE